MKKPVIETDCETMWDYEYQAKNSNYNCFLASNSLINLKKEVRDRGWSLAWISTSKGELSYGRWLVDEYPYKPRY